jgi:hypothetical protein
MVASVQLKLTVRNEDSVTQRILDMEIGASVVGVENILFKDSGAGKNLLYLES